MENVSYVGLSQQMALQREMDITANNLANMNTTGYKSQNALFLEYLNKAKGNTDKKDTVTQVIDHGMYRDLSAGSLKQTFNKLDFAISGEGYFAVQTPTGTKYTRDGSFALNDKGELVNKSGYQVMGDGGPLTIPSDATDISMAKDGTLSTDKGPIGKIKITAFDNEQALKPVGGNLLESGTARERAVDKPGVEQGAIESSNVNPIVEMNKMIQVLRMYQASQRMLLDDHQRILGTIQKLTQV